MGPCLIKCRLGCINACWQLMQVFFFGHAVGDEFGTASCHARLLEFSPMPAAVVL